MTDLTAICEKISDLNRALLEVVDAPIEYIGICPAAWDDIYEKLGGDSEDKGFLGMSLNGVEIVRARV